MNIRDDHIELYYPVRLPIQQQALGNNEHRLRLTNKIDALIVSTFFIAGCSLRLCARATHEFFLETIGTGLMAGTLAELSRRLIPFPRRMPPVVRSLTYAMCGAVELMMLEHLSKKFFHWMIP